jgi:hypothetical protein
MWKKVFLALYFNAAGKALRDARCKIQHPVKLSPASRSKSEYTALQNDFTASNFTASVGDALRASNT